MNDLISRQAAIDVADSSDCIELSIDDVKKVTDEVVKGLKRLPSAQPETHEKRTETHACDCISRQAALEPYQTLDDSDTICIWLLRKNIEQLPSAQPRKKLTFSERQKITREYHEWCLINNAFDCAESFLAFLCIKGYIDG